MLNSIRFQMHPDLYDSYH